LNKKSTFLFISIPFLVNMVD